jgi:hypothetical protein
VWDEGFVTTTLQGGYGRGVQAQAAFNGSHMCTTCPCYIAKFFLGAVRPGQPGNGRVVMVTNPDSYRVIT